jgi:hypothetical protein
VSLMLTRFHKMKLWFVKRLKEWNTCCYKYHREVNELRLGANNMKTIGNNVQNHCACLCETVYKPKVNGGSNGDPSCVAHTSTYDMLTSIMCFKNENAQFHNKNCHMGECKMCGIQLLKVCPVKLSTDKKT